MFNFAVFANDWNGNEFCGRGNSPQTAWENLIEGNGLDNDIDIDIDTVQFYQEASVTRELKWVLDSEYE